MADTEAKALILDGWREKLRLSKLFRWNSCLKHGIPIEKIDAEPPVAIQETPVQTSTKQSEEKIIKQIQLSAEDIKKEVKPKDVQIVKPEIVKPEIVTTSGNLPPWIPYLIAILSAIVGIIGGGLGISAFMNSKDNVSVPAVTTEAKNTENVESPLQWLEDQGEHLP